MARGRGESSTDAATPGTARATSVITFKPTHAPPRPTLWGRIYHWYVLLIAALLLLIFAPPVLLWSRLVGRPEVVYPWARFGARNWLRLSGMKVVVRGLERLDPRQPYMFIANHRSYLDTAAIFHHLGRDIGVLAKKELLKVPILGYGMGHVNIMAIDRTNRERAFKTVQAATDKLRSGVSFVVFAEGTRARPGQLLPFKKGAFYMAVEAGVPIVPVAIRYTDELMGKGTGVARPGTFEMIVMPPIETVDFSSDEDVKQLTETTRARIAAELARES